MDNELFELCKEVYERTKWFGTEEHIRTEFPIIRTVHSNGKPYEIEGKLTNIPLYTSDYLLEKLPATVENTDYNSGGIDRERRVALKLRKWDRGVNGGIVYFAEYHEMYHAPLFNTEADTPLKALLKLTIALHEAGELK